MYPSINATIATTDWGNRINFFLRTLEINQRLVASYEAFIQEKLQNIDKDSNANLPLPNSAVALKKKSLHSR